MQPDGTQKQILDTTQRKTGGIRYGDKRIVCDDTTSILYWATPNGKLLRPFFNLSCYDYFSFSPDDEWVYMVENNPVDGATLFRSRLDGSERQEVYKDTDDNGLSIEGWSPDKEWAYIRIAWNSEEVDAQLARMRPDGSDFQMLIEERFFTFILEWSPDNKWLILDSYGGGLYRMRPDGSQLERMTHGFFDTWLGWTSDYTNVIFSDTNHLWAMNWETGERHLLSPYKLTDYLQPCFSPDKQWILYETYSDQIWGYTGSLGYDWRLVRIDGWRDIRLTHDAYAEHSPVWSPDGQWLYFGVTTHGHVPPSMYRIRLDGTGRQPLAGSAYPIHWQETPNRRWNPTQLAIIGLVTWSVGTFAPFLRRRKRLFPA